MSASTTSVYDYLRAHEARTVDELIEFAAIPSVSTDPAYADGMAAAAAWVAGQLTRAGMDHVQILPTARHPVVYADWLAGLGLLVIVDHGDGYLSLYGHNDELYRKVGERVTAGDPLAAAGDSGGRSQPELYFALRRGGRAIDPRPWFRNPRP